MQDQEKKNVIKSERSVEDIIILYDDGTVKRLDKGMVIHFKDPEPDKEGMVGMTFDLLEMKGQDLGLVVTSIMQFGLEMGMFDDPIFNGEEGADDE